ncbi:retinoid-inducible serine carboxypeptidase-like isoform X1 [Frankliniella occidentalis]|uniref:Retinoid-inducible serine carboxypeptidase n=1 Tax=Frankliniella occidentalis TaxID=133901 RepID=A0A6J1SWD8_FRAOC|nr:retinoid-inducible serine carboxypeptidase-like isoform X1 [Frankliniella occidentalis]
MSAYTVAAACAVLAVLLAAGPDGVQARKGFGDGDQEFGYVDVRDGAHMFYWLYYIQPEDKSAVKPADKPLVIWLQGGPGASSTSYGNFMELGPLDANLKRRNSTWVKHVNVLFIDNPVGTGYSYVDHYSQLATDNKQIAADLVAFTKGFMKTYPQFQKTPLYIFCESYGGKMTAEFALRLYEEQKAGNVLSNLKGVALGDSWISPIDSVMTWAPYLLHTGMVDTNGYNLIMKGALQTKDFVENGLWDEATDEWGNLEGDIDSLTFGVDFYNILSKIQAGEEGSYRGRLRGPTARKPMEVLYHNHVVSASDDDLNKLMDEKVKPALGVIPDAVRHQTSSSAVFNALGTDFMKPVTSIVEQLLNETDVKVVVLSGQLDLIVDTPGTLAWVERLHWKMGDFWVNQATREPLVVDNIIEGFVKDTSRLAFYWISRAGHMVPADNPAASIEVLKRVTGLNKKTGNNVDA